MFPQTYPQKTYPQSDACVRELVVEGRRMFRHSPLSDLELEILARSAIKAELVRLEIAEIDALAEELERASVISHTHPESSSPWVKIQRGLFMRVPETSGHCASDAALQAYDAEYEKIKRRAK